MIIFPQHVPVGGGEKELELFSHSRKHHRGKLTVHLNIVDKGEVSGLNKYNLTQ